MAYVDLYPVRAGMASSPETFCCTSIQDRMNPSFDLNQAIDDQRQCGDLMDFKTPIKPLLHFDGGLKIELQVGILFPFRDYLELVDWTGRITRKDKRSHIDNALPPILHRLQISPRQGHLDTT